MKTTLLFDERMIHKRIQNIAIDIRKTYRGKPFVLLGVLNGAYMFTSDMSKALWEEHIKNFTVDFVGISSYKDKTTSTKKPIITKEPGEELENKNVLILEDIVDTGLSLDFLKKYLSSKKCASIRVCSLLSKPSRREIDVQIDFLGFEIPDVWVEGYGMDTTGLGRGNPEIVELLEE